MNKQQNIRYVFTERIKAAEQTEGDRGRLRKDIRSFLSELSEFRISLRTLCDQETAFSDRNKLLNIALELINHAPTARALVSARHLPVAETAELTGYPADFIRQHHDYIVAYMLLFGTEQHSFLSRQLSIGTKLDGTGAPLANNLGIKLKDYGITSVVLTPYGEFRYLEPSRKGTVQGDFVTGSQPILKPRRALLIASAALGLLLIFLGFAYTFYQPVRSFTLMGGVEASFSFNRFGRLVDIQGLNPNGRSVVSDLIHSDRKVNSSLARFLDASIAKEVIEKNSDLTLIVVEGTFNENDFKGDDLELELKEHQLRLKVNQGNGNGFILTPDP
ncbi:hypothetical protein [Proteiniclasticum sp. QWL-01]|uniref:hypothetical protein n=1 Tax=Proteiniclasticum sp. QWL-01 TaxID=3036945 RepID=UPI00240F0DEC|nr:hypothetical protein [Proteiniclasticum sp. QWL-01]WFF72320.1 hypothetical protein P6M73_13660 [Proteiniclasticum sp. QWL-01]